MLNNCLAIVNPKHLFSRNRILSPNCSFLAQFSNFSLLGSNYCTRRYSYFTRNLEARYLVFKNIVNNPDSSNRFNYFQTVLDNHKSMSTSTSTADKKDPLIIDKSEMEDFIDDSTDKSKNKIEFSTTEEPVFTISDEKISEIAEGAPEVIQKIKFILMEHELLKQEGRRVPVLIEEKRWSEILALKSRSQRKKYFEYLWEIEIQKLKRQRKKVEDREKFIASLSDRKSVADDPYWMEYGLNRNAIFLRLYDTKVQNFFHHRVISEMVLNPKAPFVIDCGYDEHMVYRESKNCAAQMEYLFTENREHPHPFNIVLCNAHKDSQLLQFLLKRIPVLYDDNYSVEVHEESYLDLYERNRLVYLTPNSRDELEEYDHDAIYIMGGMVDKSDPRPFSYAKAKREGIKMKRLPLDKYVEWGLGNKSLTLNQIVQIMLTARATNGNWAEAFQFIPRRKLRREDEINENIRRERPSSVLKDFKRTPYMRTNNIGFREDRTNEFREKYNRNGSSNNSYFERNRSLNNKNVSSLSSRNSYVKTILRDDE